MQCPARIPGDRRASQQYKAGPAKEAWWSEEVQFEIERLKAAIS